jgi:hypothetical protein
LLACLPGLLPFLLRLWVFGCPPICWVLLKVVIPPSLLCRRIGCRWLGSC